MAPGPHRDLCACKSCATAASGRASAQHQYRERFFLNLQFFIMLWPDVKVVPIWHGCKLKSQAIKISSFSS